MMLLANPGADKRPLAVIGCGGRREMAENGDTIRSSPTTPTPATTTATPSPPAPPSSSSSPPPSASTIINNNNLQGSSGLPVTPKLERLDSYSQQQQHHVQKQLPLSPMCNGYGTNSSPPKEEEGASASFKICEGEDSAGDGNGGRGAGEPPFKRRNSSPMDDVSKGKDGLYTPQQVAVKQENDQDGPLDFSLRRRDSVSESFTDDSRASSSTSPPSSYPLPGGIGGGPACSSSRHSPEADHHHHSLSHQPHRNQQHHQQPHQLHHGLDGQARGGHRMQPHFSRSPGTSPELSEPISESKAAGAKSGLHGGHAGGGGSSRLPPNSSLAALGLMAEGGAGGMTPAAVAAMLGQNGGMIGSLGSMSGFLGGAGTGSGGDIRKMTGANGGKTQRPFKAYPKEALQMPLGYLGLPGINPFSSMDQSCLQGISASQEEILSMYKQQMEYIKEREKQMMSLGKMMTGSPPSSTSSSSTSSSSSSSTTANGSSSGGHSSNKALHHPTPPTTANHSHSAVAAAAAAAAASSHPPPLIGTKSVSPPAPYFSPPPPSHASSSPSHTPSSLPPPPPHTTSLQGYGNHHHHHHQGHPHLPNSSSQFSTPAAPPLVSSTSSLAGGSSSGGISGSRKRPRSLPENQKDEAYWERRRKNNDAAKRSRDARRAKEDEIAIRAALLEQENLKLRVEVAALKTETARLRCMLYNT